MIFRAIVLIITFIILAIVGYNLIQLFPTEPASQPEPNSEEVDQSYVDLIRVENLSADQVITSPLTIKGQARGYWFFEASFSIKLLDEKGEVIAVSLAQAQSEWMTEEFVPFEAVLEFDSLDNSKGVLIFEKDNPSGLPENTDEFRLPILFNNQNI
jgi:hypothetical protein